MVAVGSSILFDFELDFCSWNLMVNLDLFVVAEDIFEVLFFKLLRYILLILRNFGLFFVNAFV